MTVSQDPFDLLDEKPPRTAIEEIERYTRSIDNQAGAIHFEVEGLVTLLDNKLSELLSHLEWTYTAVNEAKAATGQLKTVLWVIAALLAYIAIAVT